MAAPPQAISRTANLLRTPSAGLRCFAWALLAYNVAVILWGALVRATGSGAGCGDHWPLCNGVAIPTDPRTATIIEFTHRLTSGITVIAVVVLLVWVLLATVPRHLARAAAIAAVILTFNEALLGALLVLLGLTAHNHSPARAAYLSLHLANTLLLLAALALTAHFLSRATPPMRRETRFHHRLPALLGLAATLAVGVTGSLAALGDTLFPASSLSAAFAQDFSRTGNWLLQLRILHPFAGFLAGAFILWLLVRGVFGEANSRNRPLAVLLLVLLAVQYALGFTDVALLAPVWMQILHLLGADLLWITLVVLAARICLRPAPAA